MSDSDDHLTASPMLHGGFLAERRADVRVTTGTSNTKLSTAPLAQAGQYTALLPSYQTCSTIKLSSPELQRYGGRSRIFIALFRLLYIAVGFTIFFLVMQ